MRLFGVFVLLTFLAAESLAQNFAPPGYPLQGLNGVTVSVLEPLLPQEIPELKASALQPLVEEVLRAGGVPIPAKGPAPQLSYLQLRVSVARSPTGPRAYAANLRLMEVVSLSRDTNMKTQAATWDASVSGPADSHDLAKATTAAVRRLCQRFVDDYRAANAKGP